MILELNSLPIETQNAIKQASHHEPIWLSDGKNYQKVLIDYQEYIKLTHRPFVSLGDAFRNILPELAQALSALDDDDENGA